MRQVQPGAVGRLARRGHLSLLFAAALRDYMRAAGGMDAVRALWPTARRQIELAEADFDENGLVRDRDQMGWCFVDWNLALNKQASAKGIGPYCLRAAIELAGALGEPVEALRGSLAKKTAADDLRILGSERRFSRFSGNRAQFKMPVAPVFYYAMTKIGAICLCEKML